jgi:Synergist-CTERM protein sorting domain-containing protein
VINAIAALQVIDGSTTLPHTITLTSTPSGTITATDLTGPDASGMVTELSRSWNGLLVEASGNKVTISGAPVNVTTSTSGTFTVKATVKIGTIETPSQRTFTITLEPKGTPAFSAISPVTLPQGEAAEESIAVTSTGGTVRLSGVTPASWNGLNLSVSGSTIAINGSPTNAGSQSFMVSGTVGANTGTVTGEFTINVTESPSTPTTPGGSSSSSSGGGGCNSGIVLLALSLLAPLALRGKKR